jgi:uncharacterized protein (TIGR02118 family)
MFAALGSRAPEAIAVARSIAGTALVARDHRREPAFRTLVIGEDRDAILPVADTGLYRVHIRPVRHQRRSWPAGEPTPGVAAAVAVLRRPDLTHDQADAHWRDCHAPLALRHHPGMRYYYQVSVDEVLGGRCYDGIALCGFESEQELAERLFGGPEDRAVILDDLAKFADTTAAPRMVRTTEWRFGDERT